MKRKNCELIKAWADGAIIQRLEGGGWVDCPQYPSWNTDEIFRIKPPTPKSDYVRLIPASAIEFLRDTEFTLKGRHLAATFDGETGALKASEVIS